MFGMILYKEKACICSQIGPGRRLTAAGVLLLWTSTFFLQAGLLLGWRAPAATWFSKKDASQLVELPRSEKARKIWLATHGARFGLTADSDVDVICTCKCCGDRCPMGASCCCSAEKIPVQRPAGACLLVQGCGPQTATPLLNIGEFRWYLAPPPFESRVLTFDEEFDSQPYPLPNDPELHPPTPIPKRFFA